MGNHGHTDQDGERLSAFALGALSAEEQAAVERHLDSGCEACRQEVAALQEAAGLLALAAPGVPAPPALRGRLRAQIQGLRARGAVILQRPGLLVTRPSEVPWQATSFAGIASKRLFEDTGRHYVTALVRLQAGTRYPAHRHVDVEELYLLEGDLQVQGVTMRAGDYCRAEAGTVHEELFSETGAIFIVMSSELNELMA
jgi:anti-sigma factor ChrR (cupin superfamily)